MDNKELLDFGAHISPRLSGDNRWVGYLAWAIRHLGLKTTQDVGLIAYGFQAGADRK